MVKGLFVLALISVSASAYYINVLNDNFNDLSNWLENVMAGADSGNNEWEYYTDSPNNIFITKVNGQNALVLRALQQNYQGYNYTSGKVSSVRPWGPYGFFNIKAIVPKGNGLWPAIWLLPPGANSIYGSWAACGEIDIMETICTGTGGYSTLHFGGQWPNNVQYPNPPNNQYPFTADWNNAHWYGVDWQPNYINFWYDAQIVNGQITGGTLISSISSSNWYSQNSNGQRYPGNAPFNQPFNIILNLAIGGSWPCSVPGCCSNVAVPAQLTIFNVQVWEVAQSEDQL
ncbi:unnamed protein product [Blepharisma stoltei]|uniref:GH16 domain-containing protein n=1 Tax=Blepharisma stoltei TaxID=1481888 RepID=A0AAU9J810_9CILI|nr:unnamed protein product [Blepharisma stoltei]